MKQQFDLKYRPDIDGLRALSVITIMIFHLNQTLIPGGFAAVSLFFVISGFLITTIIAKLLVQDRFSFKDFYARRIKRILPLFFVVVFTVLIFAIIILRPWDDFGSFWKTVRYAMQFRANQAFFKDDYFGAMADEKPLMHLWTLAIEEQFYFIWPITIFILYKIFKNKQSPRHWLFWSTIVLICLSIMSSFYLSHYLHANPYFYLKARSAEILVGCAIALSPYTIPVRFRTPLGMIGIGMIILSYFIYDPSIAYPGFYGLLPSVGAALFILDTNVSSYKKIFTNRVATTIGVWSFSVYLWHWPILAFLRYIYMDVNLPISWMVFAYTLTFTLSYFTYNYVENPIRKWKFGFTKSLIIIYIIPCIILSLMHDVVRSNGFREMLPFGKQVELTRWFNDEETPCNNQILDNCTLIGDLSSDKKYLLVGDSHAAHLSVALDEIGKKEHWKVDIISANSCPAYFAYSEEDPRRKEAECIAVNEYFKQNWEQYDGVMFSQLYSGGYTSFDKDTNIIHSTLLESYPEMLREITQKKPVYIISDVPNFEQDPLRVEWLRERGLLHLFWRGDVPLTSNFNYLSANKYLQDLAEGFDNVFYIDITKYIPADSKIDGKIIYRDPNHLNPYGSGELGKRFIKDQILIKTEG